MVQNMREAIANFTTSKSFGNDTVSSYFLELALPWSENFMAMLFNTWLLPFAKKEIEVKIKYIRNIGSVSDFKALQKTSI